MRTSAAGNGELYLCGSSYTVSAHFVTAPFAGDIKSAVLEVQDCERYNCNYGNDFYKFVKGKMAAKLTVRSNCEDTCFYMRLSLCKTEGDYGLRDDISQLSNVCADYFPGDRVEMAFSFDAHAFVIHKGEKLRIDISASAYPHYVRHANQKGLFSEQTTAKIADNTVILDGSYLVLPIGTAKSRKGDFPMREYTIARVSGTPDFSAIEALPIDTLLWSPEVPITASAKICYDDTGLYVRLSAREPHIRAEERGPLGVPCEDSCLEFFFCPMDGDDRYLSIECNPNGCLYLGFCNTGRRIIRLLPDEMQPIQPAVQMTDGGWEVTYTIPAEYIRLFFPTFQLKSGNTIRANCYKCGDSTVQPHYLSWNPVEIADPDFHRPDFFGLMHLA